MANTKNKKQNVEKKEILFTEMVDAKPLTRFLAFISDFVLLIVLGVIVYNAAAFPIANAITKFDGMLVERSDAQEAMYDAMVDAHLLTFHLDEDGMKQYDELDAIYDDYLFHKVNDEANLEGDMFYYFYFEHAKDYYEMDVDTFNREILKVGCEDFDLFIVKNPGEIGVLKDEVRVNLEAYLNDSQTAEALNTNEEMQNLFLTNYNFAYFDVLMKYDENYIAQYELHESISNDINWTISIPSVISFTFAAIVLYLIIPLVFRNGETLAKKILKIGVVDRYGYRVSKYQTIIRFIIKYILQVGISVFMPMFIVGINEIWGLPFLSMFGQTMNMTTLFIISLIFGLVSSLICLIHKEHLDLEDLAAHTEVVIVEQSVIFNSRKEKEDYLKMIEEEKLAEEGGIVHGGKEGK